MMIKEKVKDLISNPKIRKALLVTKDIGLFTLGGCAVVMVILGLAALDGYIESKIDPEGFAKTLAEEANFK